VNKKKLVTEQFILRRLMRKDVAHLIDGGFCFSKKVIAPPITHKLLQVSRLAPPEIGLVAVHVKDGLAIGHLRLVNHTNSLYSIQCVFTNPRYRRMGVASGLINYAFTLARRKGGKKIFLTADPLSPEGELYSKLGFTPIINASTILTAGSAKSLSKTQHRIIQLDRRSKSNKQKIYNLYENCLGPKWVEFFETNNENIFNGFSQNFRRSPFRMVFIDNSENCFALVKSSPLLGKATVEICSASDNFVMPMLKGLFWTLRQKEIVFLKITILNIKTSRISEKGLSFLWNMYYAHRLTFMGKPLSQ
jgi:N-acetylglutamate synthase-like GNAT family acetyltransferase